MGKLVVCTLVSSFISSGCTHFCLSASVCLIHQTNNFNYVMYFHRVVTKHQERQTARVTTYRKLDASRGGSKVTSELCSWMPDRVYELLQIMLIVTIILWLLLSYNMVHLFRWLKLFSFWLDFSDDAYLNDLYQLVLITSRFPINRFNPQLFQ